MIQGFKGALILTAISLLGLLFSLLLIEGGYRLVNGMQAVQPSWSDRPSHYLNPRNSKTLQGNSYESQKPAGTYRIAVLGDSFTFAPFMQPDDAFPARLERFLRMSALTKKQEAAVEVINYGVPGYSTSHEVQEARKALAEGADFLLLQITLNDPQRKSYQPTGLTGQNEFGPYEPSHKLKPILHHWKSLNYFLERIHNTNTHTRYVDYYYELFEKEASWKGFEGSIQKLAKIAKKQNKPLVAVVFPLFGVPLNDNYPFHPLHKKVQKCLEAAGIPYRDLFSLFEGIPLERLQVIPGADFHPNEIGHRLAAESIYEWFHELDDIPDKFLEAPQFLTRTDIRILQENRRSQTTPMTRDKGAG
jgi:lysophospholipase L1-like esterase